MQNVCGDIKHLKKFGDRTPAVGYMRHDVWFMTSVSVHSVTLNDRFSAVSVILHVIACCYCRRNNNNNNNNHVIRKNKKVFMNEAGFVA
jgi:hypothetical protein